MELSEREKEVLLKHSLPNRFRYVQAFLDEEMDRAGASDISDLETKIEGNTDLDYVIEAIEEYKILEDVIDRLKKA